MTEPQRPFPELDLETRPVPRSLLKHDTRRDEAFVGKTVLAGTVAGLLIAAHWICWLCLTGQLRAAQAIGFGSGIGIGLGFGGGLVGLHVGRWWTGMNKQEIARPPERPDMLGPATNGDLKAVRNSPTNPEQKREDAQVARSVVIGAIVPLVGVGLLAGVLEVTTSLGLSDIALVVLCGLILVIPGCYVGHGVGRWRIWTPLQRRVVLREMVFGLLGGLALGFVPAVGILVHLLASLPVIWSALVGCLWLLIFGCVGAWFGYRKGEALALFYRAGKPGTVRFPGRDSRN